MKYIRNILAAALAAALIPTLASCQLSKLRSDHTEEETTGPLLTFTLSDSASTSAAEPLDLMSEDLTQYVTLPTYKGLTADETVTPLTDADFEAELTAYLASVSVYEEITDRAAAQGDTVIMDYEGKLDGVAFSGGTAQGQSIELSENSGYIDGFADGLIGVMPGSTVDLTLTFPTDYHATDMAGKTVVFTVTVHYIRGDLITPEATDAYITRLTDGEYTSIDAFRTYYREYLEEAAVSEAHSEAVNSLWSMVMENTVFHSVPEQQIAYYLEQVKAQYEYYALMYGTTYDTILTAFGLTEDTLRSQAEQYAKQDLVFYSLVKAEGLEISDDEYTVGLAEYALSAGATAAELEEYYGADYIRESLLWDKMLDMLYDNANITK